MTLQLAGRAAAAVLLLLLPLQALAASAEQAPLASSVGVQVAPARIDLAERPQDGSIMQKLTVINRGSARTTFSVSVVDLIVHDGIPEALPPTSTPYSLAALTTVSPTTLTLDPGKEGSVKVTFDVSAHRPFLGALVVAPGQQPAGSGTASGGSIGVVQVPQALIAVSAAPVDQTGELLPSVSLGVDPFSLQVPTLLESGPIVARSTVRDSGTFFERLTADYTFSAFGHPFLTVKGVPADAMPNQTATTTATTRQRLELSGQTVDAAPLMCVCTVTVQTYAMLANRRTVVPVTQTAYVVIFPWRLAGVLLGLIALGLVARWVLRRRAVHP